MTVYSVYWGVVTVYSRALCTGGVVTEYYLCVCGA